LGAVNALALRVINWVGYNLIVRGRLCVVGAKRALPLRSTLHASAQALASAHIVLRRRAAAPSSSACSVGAQPGVQADARNKAVLRGGAGGARGLPLTLAVTNACTFGEAMKSIQSHRDFFARFVVRSVGSTDERLISAFSSVERERFVGAGPWPVFVGTGYIDTVSDDPRLLYQDLLIGIATNRGINNGQPSLHARCLAACAPTEGESVIHIGAGSGYYTAILASLVGPTGSITAYEVETDIAERARQNLRHRANITVAGTSGAEAALPPADLIYVNAGATHPLSSWLDALKPNGRLLFPLTPDKGFGVMLLVRRGSRSVFGASVVCRAAFIPCIGARDEATSNALTAALETQSTQHVRSLHVGTPPDSSAWCVGIGWWLSRAALV